MQLDPVQFLHHLEPFDMNEAQKTEYVRAIIHIMQSFVDRAFGDAPEQVLLGTNENRGINCDFIPLESDNSADQTFNNAAVWNSAGKYNDD